MEYRPLVLPAAIIDLEKLSSPIRKSIIKKVFWLSENAESVIHHPLKGMPIALAGLCKLRVGDFRVLYWKSKAKKEIQVFRIKHRSEVYHRLN